MECKRLILVRLRLFCAVIMSFVILLSANPALVIGGGLENSQLDAELPQANCYKEFDRFLLEFSENIDVQRKLTRFPLKRMHLDLDADPEPKPVYEVINQQDLKFPIILNDEDRKARGLNIRIKDKSTKSAKVELYKEDTDYQVIYFFSMDRCWLLDHVEDWSL
jgi:hypothetical protein